jgi:hypothetical protein
MPTWTIPITGTSVPRYQNHPTNGVLLPAAHGEEGHGADERCGAQHLPCGDAGGIGIKDGKALRKKGFDDVGRIRDQGIPQTHQQ